MIMDDETTSAHPSYGMIAASRVSGQASLFGVDYPQGHFITLTISTGEVSRSLGTEWFYGRNEVVQVAMSEVQWARMIASMNTSGIPCTLQRARGEDGKYQRIESPPAHMADAVIQKAEVASVGVKIASQLDNAAAALAEMMQPNAKISKAKLSELQNLMRSARQNLECNLPFYVKQAQEAVEKATEQGKAEVSAYADHVVAELGKTALEKQLSEGGVLLSLGHNTHSQHRE
jgi:hypothetical protein